MIDVYKLARPAASASVSHAHRLAGVLRVAVLAGLLVAGSALVATVEADTAVDERLDTLFGEHEPIRAFLADLKTAVADGDHQAVAAMVDYPFKTEIEGKAVTIDDASGFVDHYDGIMTPAVQEAIAAQDYDNLFANYQGAMVGDGEVWFSPVGEDEAVKIIAVNQ
ncbi:hypothetical protein L1787_17665 [Acuticoccus sp. M5D2P5]|uniref:hypothetical protein n=1 Tax=Acuticoccus kalidii TaxID=2910977 RepID=UPI001F19F08B|nr:hypothetical protein [Acuticoccus kalidii]MCF3935230.1 hypothetical protein [Acuticoccus kalidii]